MKEERKNIMGKKKTKLYQTTPPKTNSKVISFTIDVSEIKTRNLMHFDAQKRFPATVVESKKHKPPKYRHKLCEEE